jgi:hypothetical protein
MTSAASARTTSCIGIACLVAGITALARAFVSPIGPYDEGILLSDARLVMHGAVPYRDFYSNYPPGIFWALALVWKVVGVSVTSERVLSVILRAVTALFAGRIAGKLIGGRFSVLACGVVWLWSMHQPIAATAYAAGLAALLVAIDLAVRAHNSGRPRDWALVGLAYGIAGCLRHDLFAYTAIWTVVALIVARFVGARSASAKSIVLEPAIALPRGRARVAFLAALAWPLALTWGWVLWKAGVDVPLHDLSLDQAHHTIPARAMPFPSMTSFHATQIALALDFAAPILVIAAWRMWRCRSAALLLGPVALAVLPQMLFISDGPHVQSAVTPALILVCAAGLLIFERARSGFARIAVAVVIIALLVIGGFSGTRFQRGWEWVRVDDPRWGVAMEDGAELAAARRRLLDVVEQHVQPDQTIFVGCARHDRIDIDEMDIYFLADRKGALRRMQFDPGLIDEEGVQASMIADLERTKPPLVVLSSRWPGTRSSRSDGAAGSRRLDDYLRARYVTAETAGPYALLLRAP